MATSLNTIKNWFKTGLKPSQAQFWATWDSFWHKDDKIPVTSVDRLSYYLDQKADQQAYQNHLNDPNAHLELFNSLQNRVKVLVINQSVTLSEAHQGCILCIEGIVVLTIPLGLENNFVSCVLDVMSGSCTIASEIGVEISGGYSLILNAGDMTSLYKRTPFQDLYRLR